MGSYICVICEQIFCHHDVICYEYGENQLICENCYDEIEEKENKND